jgi:hypothetical protein
MADSSHFTTSPEAMGWPMAAVSAQQKGLLRREVALTKDCPRHGCLQSCLHAHCQASQSAVEEVLSKQRDVEASVKAQYAMSMLYKLNWGAVRPVLAYIRLTAAVLALVGVNLRCGT